MILTKWVQIEDRRNVDQCAGQQVAEQVKVRITERGDVRGSTG